MSNELKMNTEAVKAQIDVCGYTVAAVAKNAYGVVSDKIMWDLNQAIIALRHAYKNIGEEENNG